MSQDRPPQSVPVSDPLRGVVLVLLGAAVFGMIVAIAGGWALGRPVVLDAALALWLATGVLLGVARAQAARTSPARSARSGAAMIWSRIPDLRSIRTITAGVGGIGVGGLLLAQSSAGGPLTTSAAAAASALALAAAGLAATAARYLASVDPAHFPHGAHVRVSYELTDGGRAFGEVAQAIERWGRGLGSNPKASRQPNRRAPRG